MRRLAVASLCAAASLGGCTVDLIVAGARRAPDARADGTPAPRDGRADALRADSGRPDARADAAPPAGITVTGTIEAKGKDNAPATGMAVTLDLTVLVDGLPAGGATVKLTTGAGSVTLGDAGGGRYSGTMAGYDRDVTLDIVAGPRRLTAARLRGPAAHRFTAPAGGTIHRAGTPLTVRWSPSGGAARASIKGKTFAPIPVPDTGSYTIAGSLLRGTPGMAVKEELELERDSGSLAVPGATGASGIRFKIENEVEVVLDAT